VDKVSGRRGFGAGGLVSLPRLLFFRVWLASRGGWIFHFWVPIPGFVVSCGASDSGGRACVTWGRWVVGPHAAPLFFPVATVE